jgi:NADH-quinone oxidoreductase subunit C
MTASLDAIKAFLEEKGGSHIQAPDWKKVGLKLSALVPKENLIALSEKLYSEGFTLLDVSTAEFTEGFLVTYHFDKLGDFASERLAFRVLIEDKGNPEVPSIYPVYQGAEWHERESHDFFGVKFVGNPNLVPLLLADDFSGPPPLKKKPEALASLSALKILGEGDSKETGPPPPSAEAAPSS